MERHDEDRILADYVRLLCGHLNQMVERLRQIPANHWDWTFAPPAPTPRILAAHAWQWLICDRQHIVEPDALKHTPVPAPPADPGEMCEALAAETRRWEVLVMSLTSEQLAAPRRQFNSDELIDVRRFVTHMIQNCIYKNGQLATIYFALGLDGDGPYDAPFPNSIYAGMNRQLLP